MSKIFLSFLLLITTQYTTAQITVTNATSAQQLAQKLVGSGVTISNVTYTGFPLSSGIFKQTGTIVPIDSGIVLTTGLAKTNAALGDIGVDGIQSSLADNGNGLAGDAQLNLLGTSLTEDATVLEFDFVPLGDSISFAYSFSSEEYPSFNCTNYNDLFAFFISGPGINGTVNMASVPGTNPPIPVTINSINSGSVALTGNASNCTGYGQGSPFTSLYLNNTMGQHLTHNGLTRKLIAKIKVTPCQTYHLKIAIADAGDDGFDSAVFLEANSLKSAIAATMEVSGNVDPNTNTVFLAEGCSSGSIEFKIPTPQTTNTILNLGFGGTATNGVDATLIPPFVTIPANSTSFTLPITAFSDAFAEGTETLTVYLASACTNGNFVDSVKIQIRDFNKLAINPADSVIVCNVGIPIQLTATAGYSTYTWDANATLSNTNIANPIATPTTLPQWYYCTAVQGTCRARDSVLIKSKNIASSNKVDVLCKGATTGAINIIPGISFTRPLQFSLNGGAPQADSNFVNLAVGAYTVTLTDASNCVRTYNFNITQLFPDLVFTETIVPPSCNLPNGTITISASGGKPPYAYSLDGLNYSSSSVLSIPTGTFTIYVRDANNCITTKVVNIAAIPAPNITGTNISAASCSGAADGSIQVNVTGGSLPLQYSSNGGTTFQNSNMLMVTSGSKLIVVKDATGCTDTMTVFVPLNNNVVLNAGNDTTICQGKSLQLNASANVTTFAWTPTTNMVGANTLTPTVTPPSTTSYVLTATLGICNKVDTITVTVRPAPVPNAGQDTVLCYGTTANLNGSGGAVYTWLPTTNLQNPNSAAPTITALQNIRYWLHVQDAFGCKSLVADTINIRVVPPVQMFAGNDTIISVNQPLQLNGTGAPIFQWIPSTWLSNPTIANPVATIGTVGNIQYILKGSTVEGCVGYDTLKIQVYNKSDVYVPTVFTPNGDGKNDVFNIVAVGISKFHYLRIFNRWGQLVHSTSDWRKGWDGKYQGKQQAAGTYVWIVDAIDFNGKPIRKKGTLLLVN